MDTSSRVTHGVWRPSLIVADRVGRIAALLSVLPPCAVVAGATAAHLHGLWSPDAHEGPLEVIVTGDADVPRQLGHSVRREVRTRRQHLRPDEVTSLGGIPITTEARTWLDLAARLTVPDLVALGDSALRGSATSGEMAELVARAVHRPGVVRARNALPLLDERSRSRPESHLRYALVSAGLPPPAVNRPIFTTDGAWLAEPDLSYDDVLLALEYNGADHAEVRRMRRDITREVDISCAGWRTETFGPVQVFQRPDEIAALVARLRRERAGLGVRRNDPWQLSG